MRVEPVQAQFAFLFVFTFDPVYPCAQVTREVFKGVHVSTAPSTPTTAAGHKELRVYGRGSLQEIFGDFVIYRNFEPLDESLPRLKVALRQTGLSSEQKPRKQDPEYARLAVWYLQEAQQLRGAGQPLSELIFIGDTLFNDGNAYRNMLRESGWSGSCFICSENLDQAPQTAVEDDGLYRSNRWAALGDWVRWMREELGLYLDERTAVVVDIDKTALGAKGRNDKVIDQARIRGAYRTMSNILGANFDAAQFENIYNELNQEKYHTLTKDNQDYLAYMCLVISTGLLDLDEVSQQVASGALADFDQFIRLVEMRSIISPVGGEVLRQSHDAVVTSVRNGDPTPFKRFRRQEFISTIESMGALGDDAQVEELLAREITLTEEVVELSAWLKARGSLLMCLSDKPDEASCPHRHVSPDLPPVHEAKTHRVGTSIQDVLDTIA